MNVIDRLTAGLAKAVSPQDLAGLDAEIVRLQALRALVAHVLELSRPAVPARAVEVPAGNAGSAPMSESEPEPTPKAPRRTPAQTEREFRPGSVYVLPILRVLGEAGGPLSMEQIGQHESLNKDSAYWAKPFQACPWFECANPDVRPAKGRPSLWRLTETGRAALEKDRAERASAAQPEPATS